MNVMMMSLMTALDPAQTQMVPILAPVQMDIYSTVMEKTVMVRT